MTTTKLIPDYFNDFLIGNQYVILKIIAFQISAIPDDVIDRITGKDIAESYTAKDALFKTDILKQILTDKEDDTNETTRHRIKLLYRKIKRFNYFTLI